MLASLSRCVHCTPLQFQTYRIRHFLVARRHHVSVGTIITSVAFFAFEFLTILVARFNQLAKRPPTRLILHQMFLSPGSFPSASAQSIATAAHPQRHDLQIPSRPHTLVTRPIHPTAVLAMLESSSASVSKLRVASRCCGTDHSAKVEPCMHE
jgi:hypothetical protein